MIRTLAVIAASAALVFVAVWAVILWPERDDGSDAPAAEKAVPDAPASDPQPSLPAEPSPAAAEVPVSPPLEPVAAASGTVEVDFKKPPPEAGLLFDVESGEVLWARNPEQRLPIASLTKMMTGLMIAETHLPKEKVMISAKAGGAPGSGIGLLPKGKRVPLRPLLVGLFLVSGNDAAVALAEHDAGTAPAFVTRMNQRAAELGLDCTHFTTPNGLRDKGNYACPADLAELARLDLANPTVKKIVASDGASLPFPIKGGKLHLANNNPFILKGTPGITGLKTGYTSRAGRCYVITARRGGRHLGVVLLDTPDPLRQVPQLLEAGFAAQPAAGPG